jgi:integrase
MIMAERQKFLEMHDQRIWQGAGDYWYTYMLIDGKRKVIKKKNRKDIDDYIIAYYKDKADDPTVKDMFYLWLNEKIDMQEIKKGTYDKYENDFLRFFNDFGKQKIKSVNEDMLETFIRHTIGELELTNKAYAGLRTLLMGIFKYAKRKSYTNISISTFFKDLQLSRKIFKQNPKDNRDEVFSEAETEVITLHLKEHPSLIHYGMLLCFLTGVRVGELVALKYSDEVGNVLHVQRQEIRYKDENGKSVLEIVDYTKTESGNRYIILTDGAKEILQKMRQYSHGEYIMQREKRIRCSTINKELYKVCKRCGLKPRSMHKIRKTYATTLIDADVDDSIVMEMMGHSDISTTRKFYYFSRSGEEKKKQQIEKAICY